MPMNRQQVSQIYRPIGPKLFASGIAFASGGQYVSPSGTIDLTWPLRALRFTIEGRITIGTAGFSTVYPHGLLELISRVYIYGVNSIIGSQVTLCDMPLSVLWDMAHSFGWRNFHMDVGGTEVAVPSMPYPTGYNPLGTTGTYDFRIVFEVPFHPFLGLELARPGFLWRGAEYKNTVSVLLGFGTQAGGGATGCFGVSGATTTIAFSSYGSSSGSIAINIYGVPAIMGKDLAPAVTPGLISRVGQVITTPLQTAGGIGTTLLVLQNRSTPRIYMQTGVLGSGVALASLSDMNVTTAGLVVGANKFIRNNVDVFAHKLDAIQAYSRDPIQGSLVFDFMEAGNADAAYPADNLDASSSFQLQATVTGVASAYGVIVQEQQLLRPAGALYAA